MRQKAEHPAAVVDGNQNDAALCVFRTIKLLLTGISAPEASSVNPECYRELFTPGLRRRPDIQVQAVLAHGRDKRRIIVEFFVEHTAPGCLLCRKLLQGNIAKVIADLHPVPGSRLFRSPPSQISDRRLRVGDSFKNGISVK